MSWLNVYMTCKSQFKNALPASPTVGVLTSSYTKFIRLWPMAIASYGAVSLSPSDHMYDVVYAQWTNMSLLPL